jgi:hypothetical protein
MGEACSRMGQKRNAIAFGMKVKRRPDRPRCRWVDNIKLDLGDKGWGDADWTGLA